MGMFDFLRRRRGTPTAEEDEAVAAAVAVDVRRRLDEIAEEKRRLEARKLRRTADVPQPGELPLVTGEEVPEEQLEVAVGEELREDVEAAITERRELELLEAEEKQLGETPQVTSRLTTLREEREALGVEALRERIHPRREGQFIKFGTKVTGEIGRGLAAGAQRGIAPGRRGPARAAGMHLPKDASGLYGIGGIRKLRQPMIGPEMLTGAGLGAMRKPTTMLPALSLPGRGAVETTAVGRPIAGFSKEQSLVLEGWKDGFRTREEIAAATGLSVTQVDRIVTQLKRKGLLQDNTRPVKRRS